MPTFEELMSSLESLGGPTKATDNQRQALERFGLGAPPEEMSFAQASRLLKNSLDGKG
jgi:hypothetical protein